MPGYLSGDDSTLAQPKGKKRDGGGHHYSRTTDARVRGHALVQGRYVLVGRRGPLRPQRYQQQSVGAARGVPFQRNIDLLEEHSRAFAPVAGTRTHVLRDRWYGAKRLWTAARDRDFLITTGLTANPAPRRVPAPAAERARTALATVRGVRRQLDGRRLHADGVAAPARRPR